MRKLIKKSLACCLVVVLTLTAMVGVFATSAGANATVTAANVEVANGETSVTVPVTIEVTDGFYAAYIQVASEFGALTAVSVPADADYDVTADGYTAVDLATGKMLVMSIYGDSLRNDITEAVVNCTFTADAAPAAGTYAVTVTCPDVDVPAADWAESVVALTPVAGVITVKAHECTPAAAVKENEKAATCTEAGSYDEVVYCSVCNEVISKETKTVDALGHTAGEVEFENEKAATCTEAGSYDEVVYCTVCKEVVSRETKTIDAKGHENAEAVKENEKAATCTVAGSYDTVVYCTVCKEVVSKETTTVDALGHNYVDGKCDVCGEEDPNYVAPVVCDHAKKTYTDNGDGTHTIGCEDCDYSVVATLDESLSTALSPTKISIGNKFGFYYSLSLRYVDHDYFEFVSSKPELNTTTFHYTGNVLPKVFKAEDATASYPTVHRYYFTYAEVALYEMSVPVTATVYVTKGEEVKYYTFAPMTLAQLGADKYNDSSSAATLKSLMADMLNLGTEAQLYFGNFKGTTGNALLACEKMPNELTTLDEQYFTDYEGKLNVIDATADAEFSATRLLIDAAPSLYFNWKESSCTNPADLTFKATYYSIAQGKNMERVCNGADLMDSEKQYGERIGRYYFNFTSIDLYDADKTITYTITHKDGRVWTCVTSVETLLSTTVNTAGDTQKLHQATASFAVATHNHWPNY